MTIRQGLFALANASAVAVAGDLASALIEHDGFRIKGVEKPHTAEEEKEEKEEDKLEALLYAEIPDEVSVEQAQEDDFSDLDALVDAAMTSVRAAQETKAARERLKRGGLSAKEREETEARLRRWEAQHEWEAEAHCAHWLIVECKACESQGRIFQGIMTRYKHKTMRSAIRYLPRAIEESALPRDIYTRTAQVELCELCAEEAGWTVPEHTNQGEEE